MNNVLANAPMIRHAYFVPIALLKAFTLNTNTGFVHKFACWVSYIQQMHTSAGSGYCDCGDAEAWSAGVHCDKHKPHRVDDEAMQTDTSLDESTLNVRRLNNS
jgi:hypothetical protein